MNNILKFEIFKAVRIKQLYVMFLIESLLAIIFYLLFSTGIFKLFIKYPNCPKFGNQITIDKYNSSLVVLGQLGMLILLIIIPFFVSIIFSNDYYHRTIQYAESKGFNKTTFFLCKFIVLLLLNIINTLILIFIVKLISLIQYKELDILKINISNLIFYIVFTILCITITSICILISKLIKNSLFSLILSIIILIGLAYFNLILRYVIFSPLGFCYYITKNHYLILFLIIIFFTNIIILLISNSIYKNNELQ